MPGIEIKGRSARANYRFGKKVEKAKKDNKDNFGMLSVKAGIDKNPNPTAADRIAGATKKNKTKSKA